MALFRALYLKQYLTPTIILQMFSEDKGGKYSQNIPKVGEHDAEAKCNKEQ
jgi:hypothetical protein